MSPRRLSVVVCALAWVSLGCAGEAPRGVVCPVVSQASFVGLRFDPEVHGNGLVEDVAAARVELTDGKALRLRLEEDGSPLFVEVDVPGYFLPLEPGDRVQVGFAQGTGFLAEGRLVIYDTRGLLLHVYNGVPGPLLESDTCALGPCVRVRVDETIACVEGAPRYGPGGVDCYDVHHPVAVTLGGESVTLWSSHEAELGDYRAVVGGSSSRRGRCGVDYTPAWLSVAVVRQPAGRAPPPGASAAPSDEP